MKTGLSTRPGGRRPHGVLWWRLMLPPMVVLAAAIAVWDLGVRVSHVQPFVLPGPLAVGQALVEHAGDLLKATRSTAACALAGFALSLVVGCVLAFIMAQARLLERSLYPYAIFLQTVPIIAIAPIIVLWFGYGRAAIIVVSFIISLFPIVTNATAGLTTPRLEWLELLRLYQASWWQVLWKVRLPGSVPHIITGAKISAGLSVVGAIVGEYFTSQSGADYGLAYWVLFYADHGPMANLMATTLMSALLGLVIFLGVSLVGSAILRFGHFQEEQGP